MLNRDDNKYQGSDDSEYHFSDDEMHYDTESDPTKQANVGHAGSGSATSQGRLKRMGIGLGVFLVLVFVVYKMVAPGASIPATDIIQQSPAPVAANAPKQQMVAAPVTQQAAASPQQNQQTAIQQMQQMTVPSQEAAAQQTEMPQQPVAVNTQQKMPGQPTQQISQSQAPANNVMQQVIPAQTSAPQYASQQYSGSPAQQMPVDSSAGSLAAENTRLANQLQAEYAQRLSEYQTQNKNLQDQVQVLNNRVANMESEMNQLIQTLTQQFQSGGAPGSVSAQPAMPVEQAGPPPKIPYAVQAIIPGRAWLRSNNGDTLTVAEGDEIKGVGRVTKIDPYDGVVEINVQGRAVALSYGNGS